jgi:hypothetical protein
MIHETIEKRKLLFFSFVGPNYSRSSTILNFESKIYLKEFVSLPTGFVRNLRAIINIRNQISAADYLVVMSPCHVVTPMLKFLSKKKIILDAGWSLTDGQLSRSNKIGDMLKLIRTYLIDSLAFHTADMVIVESNQQATRTIKLFKVPKKKIEVNFTGLDETAFNTFNTPSGESVGLDQKLKNVNRNITVLFRGKINNESGFDNILAAAAILENQVRFILVCGSIDSDSVLPSNTVILSNLTNAQMSEVYRKSDIALGQLSNHPRLRYTIPHKAFEAGFFAKPYITTDSSGIRELYSSDSVILMNNISGVSLASEIMKLSDPDSRQILASKIHASYQKNGSQEILNQKFEWIIENL